MKRITILIIILICAFASYGQIRPFTVTNNLFQQVWNGDTNYIRIYPGDSIVYYGSLPAWLNYSGLYMDEFRPGLGDTNILFVNGTTGRVQITNAAAIGGSASSKWTFNGTKPTSIRLVVIYLPFF